MNISKGTIIRTVLMVTALVNSAFMVAGKPLLPFDDAFVDETVTQIYNGIVAIMCFWKNNSFTAAAIKADQVLKEEKQETK